MPPDNDTSEQIDHEGEFDLADVASTPFATATISASVGLPSLPADATKALVSIDGGSVRWRPDGATTAPTSSVGLLLGDGTTTAFLYGHAALAAVRLVAASGTPAANVCYFT